MKAKPEQLLERLGRLMAENKALSAEVESLKSKMVENSPILTTRTMSAYFSPKSAAAPVFLFGYEQICRIRSS